MSSSPFEVIIDPYFRIYENRLLWNLLPKFFMEAKFTVTQNCVKIQAQSPRATIYVQITLFKDFFLSLKGNHVFQLRVYSKKYIPHFKLTQDCKYVIWSSERNSVFNYEIKYYSNRRTRFEAIEDNSFKFRPVFCPLKREVEFCIPTKLLHKILDDMKSEFSLNTDKFKLTSDNTLGNVAFSYDLGGIVSYSNAWLPYEESYLRFFKEGKIESEYNWHDMYTFLDSVRSSFPNLRVTYSTNGPLELRGKIGIGIDLIEIKAIFSTKSHFKIAASNLESSEASTAQLDKSGMNSFETHFFEA